MKKKLISILLALASLAMLAGCRDKDDSSSDSQPSSSSSSSSSSSDSSDTTSGSSDTTSDSSDTTSDTASSDTTSDSSSSTPEDTTHTITFNTNGGTAVASFEVEDGESVDLSQYLTSKDNSYFYSWCFDAQLTDRAPIVFVPEMDVTLYAEWGTEEKYLLSFATGEGSAIEPVFYAPNAYLVAPQDPTLENYAFAGWYKDANYTREFTFFGNTMPRRNVTVYAKWTELFAIHFDTQGGSAVESLRGEVGEVVYEPEEPVKEGYVFEGWFLDKACTKPYSITKIPDKTVTVYAGWHQQQKDVTIRLHLNSEFADDVSLTVTGDEGTMLDDEEVINSFLQTLGTAFKPYFLDASIDPVKDPVYNFNGWSYSQNGRADFNGKIPQADGEVVLYATWSRSSKYCEVKFLATEAEEQDIVYFVVKNTVIADSVLKAIETPLKQKYKDFGCVVDGFYTSAGLRYVAGQEVVMDMQLSPYLYSSDIEYQYVGVTNASGNIVYGYMVKGYDPESTNVSKDMDSLMLIIPEYYDDGEKGSKAVLWIDNGAFEGYPITKAQLPKRLMGIGAEAFKNTKIESIEIPSPVFEISDYAFEGCEALASITFKGTSISWLGSKIFKGTPYEAQSMPRDKAGFVYFDEKCTIIYDYVGTETEITTPEQANIIAGGAFRGNTILKKVTLHDNVRLACDNAFAGSALEEVVIGQNFRSIGENMFKDCVNLTTVTFNNDYNITYIGLGMFQNCTSLKSIDLSMLSELQLLNPYSFYGCTNLSEVLIPRGRSTATGIVSNFVAVGQYAFAECSSLRTISFPTSLAMLDSHCFENSAITSLTLSSSLQILGEYAFANCDNLQAVNLRAMSLLPTIEEGVFMDCDSLLYVVFSDYVTEVKDRVFEGCDKLIYVNFGVSKSATLKVIGDRVFANCTSLRKIVFPGSLNADEPVVFGEDVFENAGYTLNDGVFRTPVIYVQSGAPVYSTSSKWKNGNVMYSFVEIYTESLKDTQYASMTVKPIDGEAPKLTVTTNTLYLSVEEGLTEFDLMAYFREINLFTVSDNDSASENCDVVISSVSHNANGTIKPIDGKYDLSATGTYAVTLIACDEYGLETKVVVQVVVS